MPSRLASASARRERCRRSPSARTNERARARGGRVSPADAVPARPRPHRPLEAVPPAEAQDAGLRRPAGRPLPHAADPHARDRRHLPRRRAGPRPERGPDRGDRRSATTSATRRSATPARRRSTASSRERFGRRFRHNEHSLRVVEELERGGRGLNLTWETRDGILHHTGEGEPATLEGKIVRLVDRVAYINHDIDDAVRAGVLSQSDLPTDEIALLGRAGLEADRHARPRPRRGLGGRRRHRPERRDRRRDARACARSCSSACTSGRRRRSSARSRETTVRRDLRPAAGAPGGAAAGRRRRCAAARHGLRRRNDRPLRARMAAHSSDASKDGRRSLQRDIVEVVSARTQLRRRGPAGSGAARFTRSARRASRSTPSRSSTTASAARRRATRSASSRRPRGSTSSARSSGSPSASASRSSTRSCRRSRGRARRRRERLSRCSSRRRRSTSATSGRRGRRSRARVPGRARARGGGLPRVPARALARRRRRSRARRGRRATRSEELVAAGLVNRRGNDYFAGRLVFPLADARGRVLGFGARRARARTIRSRRST